MRTYWGIILVCGLLLTGCGEKETVTSAVPVSDPAAKPAVVEQVEKSADEVVKQAAAVVETGTQLVKETSAAAVLAGKEVVTTVTEDASATAEVAKQKTTEIVDSSKQEVVEVKEQLTQEGTQLSDSLLSSAADVASSVIVPSEVVTEVQISEILVIKSERGDVTLTHAEHGKLYSCASCHGDAVPGAFELGKDTAHAMCKDCHKEKGGPVTCGGCHKK